MQNGRKAPCLLEERDRVLSHFRMACSRCGYLDSGSGHDDQKKIKTAVRRSYDGSCEAEVPIQVMAALSLCRRLCRHRSAPLPTWGQVKSLSAQAQIIVQLSGKVFTAESLFLVMCALLTATSQASSKVNVSYWAYIPNPPMLERVSWAHLMF